VKIFTEMSMKVSMKSTCANFFFLLIQVLVAAASPGLNEDREEGLGVAAASMDCPCNVLIAI
jgi:hypothetical protein